MSVETAKRTSVWVDTGPEQPERPRLEATWTPTSRSIGGGIVGITTALLLAEAGARVVLLEADRLAGGVSGYTTAKVSSQHGLIYDRLRSEFGADAAHGPTARPTRRRSRGWPSASSRTGSTATSAAGRPTPTSGHGVRAAQDASARRRRRSRPGCRRRSSRRRRCRTRSTAAVRFDDQAEFHVRKYLLALAAQLEASGCEIFERSHAVQVDDRRPLRRQDARRQRDRRPRRASRRTTRSSTARSRSRACPSSAPTRSRAGSRARRRRACTSAATRRRARSAPCRSDGEELLLVGGEGHKTGEGGDTEERYARLEAFAREHWDVQLRRVPLVVAGRHDDRLRALRRARSRRAPTAC